MNVPGKKVIKNILYIMILICSIPGIAPPIMAEEAKSSKRNLALPVEISGYYDDLNFIVSYSTPIERNRIRQIKDNKDLRLLPDRLKKTAIMLKNLDRTVIKPDSEICRQPGNQLNYKPFPLPELNEITEIKEDGDSKIMVYVFVGPLSSEENAVLISDYDKSDIKDNQRYPA